MAGGSSRGASLRASVSVQSRRLRHHTKMAAISIVRALEKNPRCVLLPTSRFRQVWDFVLTLGVLYNCWKVPILVAFPPGLFYEKAWKYLDASLDIFFWCDLLMNFRTGYVHNGEMHTSVKDTVSHYVKGWFCVDLLASIPFELFMIGMKTPRKSVKLWKVFKLSKLLRVGRIVRYLRKYFQYRHLMMAVFLLLLLSHWFTCLWFGVEAAVDHTRYDEVAYGGLSLPAAYFPTLDACVAALLAMAPMGGALSPLLAANQQPLQPEQHALSAFMSLVGVCLLSFMVGQAANIVRLRTDERSTFRLKVDRIMEEMRVLGIAPHLQYRVRKYYDYLWLNNRSTGAVATEMCNDEDLSTTLRTEIAVDLAKTHFPLQKLSMFAKCSDACLAAVVQRLRTHVFMPREFVCRKGELGRELFYIRSGEVEVILDEQSGWRPGMDPVLHSGSFFGEVALLTDGSRRSASIAAVTISELSVLTKEDLHAVFDMHPEYAALLRRLATERLERDRAHLAISMVYRATQRRKQQRQRQEGEGEEGSTPGADTPSTANARCSTFVPAPLPTATTAATATSVTHQGSDGASPSPSASASMAVSIKAISGQLAELRRDGAQRSRSVVLQQVTDAFANTPSTPPDYQYPASTSAAAAAASHRYGADSAAVQRGSGAGSGSGAGGDRFGHPTAGPGQSAGEGEGHRGRRAGHSTTLVLSPHGSSGSGGGGGAFMPSLPFEVKREGSGGEEEEEEEEGQCHTPIVSLRSGGQWRGGEEGEEEGDYDEFTPLASSSSHAAHGTAAAGAHCGGGSGGGGRRQRLTPLGRVGSFRAKIGAALSPSSRGGGGSEDGAMAGADDDALLPSLSLPSAVPDPRTACSTEADTTGHRTPAVSAAGAGAGAGEASGAGVGVGAGAGGAGASLRQRRSLSDRSPHAVPASPGGRTRHFSAAAGSPSAAANGGSGSGSGGGGGSGSGGGMELPPIRQRHGSHARGGSGAQVSAAAATGASLAPPPLLTRQDTWSQFDELLFGTASATLTADPYTAQVAQACEQQQSLPRPPATAATAPATAAVPSPSSSHGQQQRMYVGNRRPSASLPYATRQPQSQLPLHSLPQQPLPLPQTPAATAPAPAAADASANAAAATAAAAAAVATVASRLSGVEEELRGVAGLRQQIAALTALLAPTATATTAIAPTNLPSPTASRATASTSVPPAASPSCS